MNQENLKEGDRVEYRPEVDSWYSGITGRIVEIDNGLLIIRWDDGQSEASTPGAIYKILESSPIVTHVNAFDMHLAREKERSHQ